LELLVTGRVRQGSPERLTVAGALGSAGRYLTASGMTRLLGSGFPYGTLTVNVIGSFLIAFIMQLSLRGEAIFPVMSLTLTKGFLGGFTTYSAFNYESLDLLSRGSWRLGFANLALTLMVCLASGALGYRAARVWLGA